MEPEPRTAPVPGARPCAGCGSPTGEPDLEFGGLKGEGTRLRAPACGARCAERLRRFAARRSGELRPSRAGMLVAALGMATGAGFLALRLDLGKALLVLSLFGAATTRLAYPDALPVALVRRLGVQRAREWLQWSGVALGIGAILLGLGFLFG